ncbi:MAG: RNA polymerase sigma factor [Planctomycetota bacterium]|nr:RNA polymerase sigma factor [Planctomycetota bacterium]
MTADGMDQTSLSLLHRAQQNEEDAWSQLIDLYAPLICAWCKRMGLNNDDTADVFQDTCRAVSNNLKTFVPTRSVGSFRSWLKTIVRTKAIDHFRKLNQQPAGTGGTDAQLRMANVIDPMDDDDDEELAEQDQTMVVQRAMELIRPDFSAQNWKAFQMVAIDGLAATEVAEMTGTNAQAIRQANYRIRRRLRLVLRDLVDDP